MRLALACAAKRFLQPDRAGREGKAREGCENGRNGACEDVVMGYRKGCPH